jgi:5'-nucleotidase
MAAHSQPLVPLASSRPRILVTNDDGIDSPGLAALRAALAPLGDVTVVAPDCNRTGAARSITMRTPLWVEEVQMADGGVGFATDGTPVDCVRLAALGFLDHPPELIVSGINLSGNLGDDITYSGTVAAAFEGIMLNTPALALSAEGYGPGYDLEVAARFAALLVRRVIEHGFPEHTLLNVNVPDLAWHDLAGVRVTTLGKRIYGDEVKLQETEGRRRRYFIYGDDLSYHHEAGTDFEAVAAGYVSITPIHFDLTARDAVDVLQGWTFDVGPPSAQPMARAATSTDESAGPLEPLPQAVLFDLDGTVIDSVELIVASFDHAMRQVMGLALPREELIAHVGKPLREQMLAVDLDRADELVAAYREFNHREHERMLRLYVGMDLLLHALRADGFWLGLVTSKSRSTTNMAFRTTGIEPLFDAIVCAEDTTRNKPFADPLLRAAELLEVAPAAAVYVGDSPFDLQAARAAGMRSVAVGWGVFPRATLEGERPDRFVRDMGELAAVLGLAPEVVRGS